MVKTKPLWKCSKCGRRFANRNQSHSCGRYGLRHHFTAAERHVRPIYDAFVRAVRDCGPVIVLPEKTRIAFQVRMSFAQLTPHRKWIDGHLVLARPVRNPMFRSVQTFSPRNHLHVFRLSSIEEINPEFIAFLREAYAVGRQDHLTRRPGDT
jgi:hypothetical protein